MTDWCKYFRNAITRILKKIEIKLGGPGKNVQVDETHLFKMPKNHRGRHNKKHNWLLVAIEEGTTFLLSTC